MGSTRYGDIPGNRQIVNVAVASFASGGQGTTGFYRTPVAGNVVSAHYVIQASQASAASASGRADMVYNGTKVVASFLIDASQASNTGKVCTLGAGSTLAAGDILSYSVASTAVDVTHPAATLSLEIEYT